MLLVGSIRNFFKGIEETKRTAVTMSKIVTAGTPQNHSSKKMYENDYQRFLDFLHDNCKVVKGEYSNFDDIYTSYVLWENGSDPDQFMNRSVIGHYLKKATGIEKITSGHPDKKAGWNNLYLGIKVRVKNWPTVRPQYGELYRFKHLFLKETGDINDVIPLNTVYEDYKNWCNIERIVPYSLNLFSNRIRRIFDKKKVHLDGISKNGERHVVIFGAKFD